MDMETVAIIMAGIGVLATLAYLGLGTAILKTLRDIRQERRGRRDEH